MQFQLTSKLNAPTPMFTLTCTSTGGPATTVSWTSNNSAVTEDSAHNITSQITDTTTATYNHTLTVTGRLVGEYECSASNNKPSSASRVLAVVGIYTYLNMKLLGAKIYGVNDHYWLLVLQHTGKFSFRKCFKGGHKQSIVSKRGKEVRWCLIKNTNILEPMIFKLHKGASV